MKIEENGEVVAPNLEAKKSKKQQDAAVSTPNATLTKESKEQ